MVLKRFYSDDTKKIPKGLKTSKRFKGPNKFS